MRGEGGENTVPTSWCAVCLALVDGGVIGLGFSLDPTFLPPGPFALFSSKQHRAQDLSQIRNLKWDPKRVGRAGDLTQSQRGAEREPGAQAIKGLSLGLLGWLE